MILKPAVCMDLSRAVINADSLKSMPRTRTLAMSQSSYECTINSTGGVPDGDISPGELRRITNCPHGKQIRGIEVGFAPSRIVWCVYLPLQGMLLSYETVLSRQASSA